MESDILKLAVSQGLWAVLFVVLLFYVLRIQKETNKKSDEREKRLMVALNQAQATNQQLAVAVDRLSGDVEEIKYTLDKKVRGGSM